jgi:hypothetical protein
MTAPVTPAVATPKRVEIPAADGVLAIAILVAGAAGASRGFAVLWVVSPLVAWFVCYSARRSPAATHALMSDGERAEFPPELQRCVDLAIGQLRAGEPRQLLADVVRQARPLFATRESAFDAETERATRADVAELVTAVCETALELSRLDGAAPAEGVGDLSARYQRAREALVTRLRDAATALSEMYASGVEHGTPASDRVAELAAEVRADASARRAAVDELAS